MTLARSCCFLFVALSLVCSLSAADLVLARDGKTNYQIILPDAFPSHGVGEALTQTARLIQAAFKANGVDLPVVTEKQRDTGKPGLFLGDTTTARSHGVEASKLRGWSYVQRVVGRDVIICGHDQPAPAGQEAGSRNPSWDHLGTVKGVADFLRQHAGTRFLYPDLAARSGVKDAGKTDLLTSPALEFLPTPVIAVPADLHVSKEPVIEFNTASPPRGSFYDVANNRFPFVDSAFGTHTYDRAIPVEKFHATHPEYFALIRTPGRGSNEMSRVKDGQYCISNPEVQELIYQDLTTQLDRGYETVDLGQPDGFRPCQCEPCNKLYDTGADWGEKLWIFHRRLAERVLAARPDKKVMMLSYILTAAPPKAFTKFPANTCINWCGTNEEDMALWKNHEVPGGFTGYVYNWCPNLGTRYTPMRTPLFVETQVRRLVKNRVQGVFRDGPGGLYGLEGPVYYIMGRMFDDAGNLQAKDLMQEFCEAAFGKERAARPMLRFYEQLYHAVEPYSQHLGTRGPAWTYNDIHGKRRKLVTDPFQLLAFLYTPRLLSALETELASAEQTAQTTKIATRLSLVRREFDYLKALMRVVHLTHAFEVQPDLASRERLLKSIDDRNVLVDSYYTEKKRTPRPMPGWDFVMFPPSGHYASHLRLAEDGYQEPYSNTSLNWNTQAVRAAPLPGAKRLTVATAKEPLTVDSGAWAQAELQELGKTSSTTTLRALRDGSALYLRMEGTLATLPPATENPPKAENDLRDVESLDVYLAPIPGKEIYYRFMVGPHPEARWDAASGFIADAMDPRHGKDDVGWNGEWAYESHLEPKGKRWTAMLRIPFKTLGVEAPAAGTRWSGNFGRVQAQPQAAPVRRSVWSATVDRADMDDRRAFGEIVFEGDTRQPK
ncbi:MAG TPA: DUF4838 domain-containing protein [Prosthecobacter sp.]